MTRPGLDPGTPDLEAEVTGLNHLVCVPVTEQKPNFTPVSERLSIQNPIYGNINVYILGSSVLILLYWVIANLSQENMPCGTFMLMSYKS